MKRKVVPGILMGLLLVLLTAASSGASPASTRPAEPLAPWGQNAIAERLPHAARPTVAYTTDGVGHALWESSGQIYYARRTPGGFWSPALRVAAGQAPVLAIDAMQTLHCVFSNQFMGNFEIYHVRNDGSGWTLPINVSHTSGVSTQPALAIDSVGTLHATWSDNVPGYWVVYSASWSGGYWTSNPVPNARGEAPAIAAAPDGRLYFAWQHQVPTADNPTGFFDIFLSEKHSGSWSMPLDVSDRPGVDSLGANMVGTPDGLAQVVWRENGNEVRYAYGRGSYWPPPSKLAVAATLARGPRIIAEASSLLHVVWDEADAVKTTSSMPAPAAWPAPQTIASETGNLTDASPTLSSDGDLIVSWVLATGMGSYGVFEGRQGSSRVPRMWLPLIVQR